MSIYQEVSEGEPCLDELYTSLARPPEAVRVRLRAAPTFKPAASGLLGELLQDMQQKLIDGGPESDGE
jgi:hypothetical protein